MPAADRHGDHQPPRRRLQVVLFSGGRGSGALTRELIANPSIDLTLAINGYDDGASTGEVRRFLGDSLGPSDFRKNAATVAATLGSCPAPLLELLELRLPSDYTAGQALSALDAIGATDAAVSLDGFRQQVTRVAAALAPEDRAAVTSRLQRFREELAATARPFEFGDCSLGNLVFAGGFLLAQREFNRAVDDYCALAGLPIGLIENVTDGANAFLVALDADGNLLATEEAIVDTARPNRIREIYLLDRPLTDREREDIVGNAASADAALRAREPRLTLNARLAPKVAAADLILYAPGTQHSSLFPSYLTPGLTELIAGNLPALKVLVTNIQPDAEITGSSAMDLVARARYYLTNKGRSQAPTPFLITHCLINDPERPEVAHPYVPLGPTEAIEDPRVVRIGNFEEGVSGRHDAARVLGPFIASIIGRTARTRVAILLHDTDSKNKIAQTLLEMVRGGLADVPVEATVFHAGPEALDAQLAAKLPCTLRHLRHGEASFAEAARLGGFDYVLLFESSGMYRGEDGVALLSQLAGGRLDAVWGSRRLSIRDIEESYRFRYQRNALAGGVSYLGSYLLSLACLLLYGRYVTDTLSGVRAVRAADALDPRVDIQAKGSNHLLLARLLGRKADVLELPVRFVPLSPERVKRTTTLDGLKALITLIRHRFAVGNQHATPRAYPTEAAARPRTAK